MIQLNWFARFGCLSLLALSIAPTGCTSGHGGLSQPVQDQPYTPPSPQVVSLFQADLQPYGRWINLPRYGQCWIPYFVANGWQPYTVGHWIYTTEGCTWVAEGPEAQWGSIAYHYGQWFHSTDWGWVWIPGTIWAPAWVDWHEGNGYAGWTPLVPEIAGQTNLSQLDVDSYAATDQFVFVDEPNLLIPSINSRLTRNDAAIANGAINTFPLQVANQKLVYPGVPYDQLNQASPTPIPQANLAVATTAEQAREMAVYGTPVLYVPAGVTNVAPLPHYVPPVKPAVAPQPVVAPKPVAAPKPVVKPVPPKPVQGTVAKPVLKIPATKPAAVN